MSSRTCCLTLAFTLCWPLLSPAQGPTPLTAQQKEKLKEAARLQEESLKLLNGGKPAEGLAAWRKKVALEKEVHGPTHDAVLESLGNLARFLEHPLLPDYTEAAKVRREVLQALEKRLGKGHWRVTDARLALRHVGILKGLNPQQRKEVHRAEQRNRQVVSLFGRGKTAQALGPALEVTRVRKELLGDKHPHYANSLNNLAALYEARGERHRALPLYLQALDITKVVFGEKHPSHATSLNNLAELYRARGDSRRALPLALKARDVYKEALGEKHPNYAISLNNLAQLYQALADYDRALPLYQQARDITREVGGEKHPNYAISLDNLADLYRAQEDYERALPLYQQARRILQEVRGEKHPDYAISLTSLADLYRARGDYERALPLYQQARDVFKETGGEKHSLYATSLHNLAQVYMAQGNYARALPLLRQAQEIRKVSLGEKHPSHANSLRKLASLYHARGDYARALPLAEKARDLLEEVLGEKHPSYATSLDELAELYKDLGDPVRALPLFQKARDIRKEMLGDRHPEYARSLNNLALLYQTQGEYARALPLYQQVLDITRKVLGDKDRRHAAALHNLALLYLVQGDVARALPLAEQARDGFEQALGNQHPTYAHSLDSLAKVYFTRGDYARALPLFLRARDLTRETLGDKHPHYAEFLLGLAALYVTQGKSSEAKACLREALAIHNHLLRDTLGGLGERPRLRLLGSLRHSLNGWLSLAPADASAPGQYAAVLAWRGTASSPHSTLRLARRRPDLEDLTRQLASVRSQLATRAFRSPDPAHRRAWLGQLDSLRSRKEEIEGRLAAKSQPFRRALARRKVDPEAIADALPEGTALVDFLVYNHSSPSPKGQLQLQGEARLLAFVVRKGEACRRIDLGLALPVAHSVRRWRQALLERKGADLVPLGRQLRQAVWQKVEPHLGGARTVLLAPDGALCSLPFAALPGKKGEGYLLEEYTFGYLPSGRHLLEVVDPLDNREPQGLVVAGDITYGKGPFVSLPGTAPEADRCREVYRAAFPEGAVTLLNKGEASEAKVKAALGKGPRYVHLATHGFFESPTRLVGLRRGLAREEELSPALLDKEEETFGLASLLKCGLAFAGASEPPLGGEAEDGILTAEEVQDLDLGGCELVMLSACQTALGQIEQGEGVMGLQRAFHAAGARTVVASLWHVDDAATSLLMQEFYHQLWVKKRPRLEALRQAQLSLLRDPEGTRNRANALRTAWARRGIKGTKALPLPKGGKVDPRATRSHPALWAAFVLSGDWR